MDFLAKLQLAALDTTRSNRAAARNRHDVLNRHQERLLRVALRSRNVLVNGVHQLHDVRLLLSIALESLQRGAGNHRNLIAGELILGQEVTDFHLDELEKLRIVNLVDFVQEDNDSRNADLTGEQDVLTGLRHRAVSRADNEDSTVHLSSTGDHVLDIVGVTRAVNVRIVTSFRLVLDVRRVDRDTALALLRSLIDHVVIHEVRAALFSENLRDRSRQRRLTVIDVTNRTNVNVRFASVKLLLCHFLNFLPYSPLFLDTIASDIFLGTSS